MYKVQVLGGMKCYWRVLTGNGQIHLTSRYYRGKGAASRAAHSFKDNLKNCDPEVEFLK